MRFDSSQRAYLHEHLAEILSEKELEEAISTIEFMYKYAQFEINNRDAYKALRARHLRHMNRILTHAKALAELLHEQFLTAQLNHGGYEQFADDLDFLISCANDDAAQLRREGRGRPSFEWRDNLIATVFHVYPAGKATKTAGSHFEPTVELLLQFLGREIENAHDVIVDALKRQPGPPVMLVFEKSNAAP